MAYHFRELWSFARCFDYLEEIVNEHAADGSWPEMWMSIKQTIYFDRKKLTPTERDRLEALERLSAPSDSYTEIEAYAFTNTWDHVEVNDGDYNETLKGVREKIVELGKLAASQPGYLKNLAPRLWIKPIDALWSFGEGLAKGSADQGATFELLIALMQAQKLNIVESTLFHGYIYAVHSENPYLARTLQERTLEVPELKPNFITLLAATPIAFWGVKKLIELARSGEVEAWRFEYISYGRVHETISDSDLVEILLAVNKLDGGVFSTIEILGMRFLSDKDWDYVPSEPILAVGRKAICRLLSMHGDEIRLGRLHGLDLVVDKCLSDSAPDREIDEIFKLLFEGIKSFRLYSFDIENIINTLIRNFPEHVLNGIFADNGNYELLVHLFFNDQMSLHGPSLNLVPVDRLLRWCNGNQDRIQKIAVAVSSYSSTDKQSDTLDNPKRVTLSDHIMALLKVAENKNNIVETIFRRTWPRGWSGSLAEILAVRSKAFAALLDHRSHEVRELAKIKLDLIDKSVRENRVREAEENNRREQRFE